MSNQAILVYDVEGMPEAGEDVVFGESDFTEKKDPKRIQENYIYMLYKMDTCITHSLEGFSNIQYKQYNVCI